MTPISLMAAAFCCHPEDKHRCVLAEDAKCPLITGPQPILNIAHQPECGIPGRFIALQEFASLIRVKGDFPRNESSTSALAGNASPPEMFRQPSSHPSLGFGSYGV